MSDRNGDSPAHLPALGDHVRREVGSHLQRTLLDLLSLGLVGKHLHWSVVGRRFMPTHLYLDELVERWHELADLVAERAAAIGYWPDGQADAIAAHDMRPRLEAGAVEDPQVVDELIRRVADIGEEMRRRIDRLGELDPISQDVLIEVGRVIEQQLWMLRAQLPQPSAVGSTT